MRAFEMSRDDMLEILKSLPESLKEKFSELIDDISKDKPDSGIQVMREFVEKFEEDDQMDNILSFTFASLLSKITTIAINMAEDREKQGKRKGLSGQELAMIVVMSMRDEANRIESAVDCHTKTCKNHKH